MSTTTDLIGLPSRSTTGMRNEIAILRTEVERLKVELGVQKVFTLAARKDRDEAEADLAAAREVMTAASDFVENVKRRNIAGFAEIHVATDASFRVLRAALTVAKEGKP